AAGDALSVHPALEERRVVVDLVAHLPVRPEQPRFEQRHLFRRAERVARDVAVLQLRTTRMTEPAGLDFLVGLPGAAPNADAGRWIDRPRNAIPLVELDHESHPSGL